MSETRFLDLVALSEATSIAVASYIVFASARFSIYILMPLVLFGRGTKTLIEALVVLLALEIWASLTFFSLKGDFCSWTCGQFG